MEEGGERSWAQSAVLLLPLLLLLSLFLYLATTPSILKEAAEVARWAARPTTRLAPLDVTLVGAALALLVYAEALALGVPLTRAVLRDEPSLGVRAVTTLVLGFGAVGTWGAALAMMGAFTAPAYHAGVAVLLALAAWAAWKAPRPPPLPARLRALGARARSLSGWDATLVALAAAAALLILPFRVLHALAGPPLEWDELIYHSTLGLILAREHGLPLEMLQQSMVGLGMSGHYPVLFPALHAPFHATLGEPAFVYAKALPVLFGLGVVVAGATLARDSFGWRAGVVATFLLLVTPIGYLAIFLHPITLQMLLAAAFALYASRAVFDGGFRWLALCTATVGLSLLLSYQGMFLGLGYLLTLGLYAQRHGGLRVPQLAALLGVGFATGGFWYLRNWIVLGNPVYPHFQGLFGDRGVDAVALAYAQHVLTTVSGTLWVPAADGPLMAALHLVQYRAFFPIWSIFTLLTVPYLLLRRSPRAWLVAGLATSVGLSIAMSPSFPRYWALPTVILAPLVAAPLAECWEALGARGSVPNPHRGTARGALVAALIAIVLLPGVTTAAGGNNYFYVPGAPAHWDYTYYLRTPNPPLTANLHHTYGDEAYGWAWLNENLAPGERVATMENRLLYIKDGDFRSILAFDGGEAAPLRREKDPERVRAFFAEHDVRYVFMTNKMFHERIMAEYPLTAYLGGPEFPIVNFTGSHYVYAVGPTRTTLTEDSPLPVHVWNGVEEERDADGRPVWRVAAGDVRPRLTTSAWDHHALHVEYYDGAGLVSFNLMRSEQSTSEPGLGQIRRTGTNAWREAVLLLPASAAGQLRFGIHVEGDDLLLRSLRVTPRDGTNYAGARVGMLLECGTLTAPAAMIHLPVTRGGEAVAVDATAPFPHRIEVFRGTLQPTEDAWWLRHERVATSERVEGGATAQLRFAAPDGPSTVAVLCYGDEGRPPQGLVKASVRLPAGEPVAAASASVTTATDAPWVLRANATGERAIVEADRPVRVTLRYADEGVSPLFVHARDPGDAAWAYAVLRVPRNGTGEVREASVDLPAFPSGHALLGLYAEGEATRVLGVRVEPLPAARVGALASLPCVGEEPPRALVHLPFLRGGESVKLRAQAAFDHRVEAFQGFVAADDPAWWLRHEPRSAPVRGADGAWTWTAETGVTTLVVVCDGARQLARPQVDVVLDVDPDPGAPAHVPTYPEGLPSMPRAGLPVRLSPEWRAGADGWTMPRDLGAGWIAVDAREDVQLQLRYQDDSTGIVHLYKWTDGRPEPHPLVELHRSGSGGVGTWTLAIPKDPAGQVILGVNAEGADLTLAGVELAARTTLDHVALTGDGTRLPCVATEPPAAFGYAWTPPQEGAVELRVDTPFAHRVEVFDGVIRPDEAEWWLRHDLVASLPSAPAGERLLSWEPDGRRATVVVVCEDAAAAGEATLSLRAP